MQIFRFGQSSRAIVAAGTMALALATVMAPVPAAAQATPTQTGKPTKIRLVSLNSASGFNLWAAKELGFYAQEGLDVESLKFVPNGPAAVAAGYAGAWDAAYLGGPPAINAGSKFGLQVAGLLDLQKNFYKVYVRNDVPTTNLAQYLPGKTALTITASNLHYFLDACLKFHGVDPKTVKMVNLAGPPNIVTAASGDQGEIISIWAPFTQQVDALGKYRAICDSNEQVGIRTFDAYVIHPNFIKASPEAAAAFIRAVYRVNALMNSDREKMLALANKYFNDIGVKLTPEQIRYGFDVHVYPTVQESITLLKGGEIKGALEQAARFLVGIGALQSVPDINFVTAEFVEAAQKKGVK